MVRARDKLEELHDFLDRDGIAGENGPKLRKALDEFDTYIVANQPLIPNYGERWRNEEMIATGFVESAVNQVVSKRMANKQQMQWTQRGAHLLLQVRTRVLRRRRGGGVPRLVSRVPTAAALILSRNLLHVSREGQIGYDVGMNIHECSKKVDPAAGTIVDL